MTTLTLIREEIADAYEHGIPTAAEVRRFKANLWPVVAGWDYVVDDIVTPVIGRDGQVLPSPEAELCRLIQLAIEEKAADDGQDPEKAIGRLITELALKRATAGFDDILDELQPGDPDYGYDVPETVRVNLDRSAA